MKWKTALTAEEAALLASDLECYKTLKAVRKELEIKNNPPPGLGTETDTAELAELQRKTEMAEEIYQALLAEIVLADPSVLYEHLKGDVSSVLDVAMRAQYSEVEDWIVPENCTVSKLSLAKWFWPHDPNIARKFWPGITEEHVYPAQPEQTSVKDKKEPSTKKMNSVLTTLAAVCEGLIDGFSGVKNTDAEAVLMVLGQKGVECPVSKKTLAGYFAEVKEL